jgi:hypothetical protein
MATKPTDRILDWASGGTTVDPGGSKEAAGWLVSERPPAHWWNWMLSSFGQWLTYFETVADSQRLEVGFTDGFTLTNDTTLTGTANTSHTTYLPGSDKFWHVRNAAGTASYVYDSADGITWSSATTIDPGTPQLCTRPTESPSAVYVGTEDEIYRTTTNLATGMTAQSATFANITRQHSLLYSSTDLKFFAVGNGYIESATTGAFPTFSAVTNTSQSTTDIAEDDSGNYVVTTTGTDTWYSTTGTSFIENTAAAPTGGFHQVFWNVALDRFVAIGGASNDEVHFIKSPGSGTWYKFFDDVYNIINLPEGVLMFKTIAAAIDPSAVLFAFAADDENDGIRWKNLGSWNVGTAADEDVIRDASGHSFQGGGDTAVWIRDASDYLAYMVY